MAVTGQCLLVTGAPGVGKTTLITRVFEALKASNTNLKVEGFYSREIREGGGQRVGFEVVTLDGRTAPLASCTISTSESFRWPTVGRYKVDIASFESVALPVLQVKEGTDLYIIDEIGKMELYSSSFLPAVLKVLESNVPVLASVPIPKFGHDKPGVARVKNHPGVKIYTLITGNRGPSENRYTLNCSTYSQNARDSFIYWIQTHHHEDTPQCTNQVLKTPCSLESLVRLCILLAYRCYSDPLR